MSAQLPLAAEILADRPEDREAPLTLLDLVAAASAIAEDEEEVVAIVTALLRSGRVRLAGGFRECHLSGRGRPGR